VTMTSKPRPRSPGSHPHADRPNWRKAETFEEYIINVPEGLEPFSQRRCASLISVSRKKLWEMDLMGSVPKELWERLVKAGAATTSSAMVNIAEPSKKAKCFERSSAVLTADEVPRMRSRMTEKASVIVNAWIDEQRAKDVA
jgi:hypothetical protein